MLEIKNLSKNFGGLKAVNNVSIKVEQGSITGLIGPNGAGKTTLFNIIAGNLNSDNGKIYFATEKGISIFQSSFTQSPEAGADNEILLSPNPLRIFNNESLTMWNLFPGSKVRIMTLSGTVLKTFQLNNNETRINYWDGKIDNGNLISSGFYLVTASHPDYKSKIGKLAVIG